MQDLGFGGIGPEPAFDSTVINRYFDWHFPLAIELGQFFDRTPGPESHIYTSHSFLVSLYLACPPGMGLHCPSEAQVRDFQAAVSKGWITWTAQPGNMHIEMMDEFTTVSAAHLSFYVDEACGLESKTVMSQVRNGIIIVIESILEG